MTMPRQMGMRLVIRAMVVAMLAGLLWACTAEDDQLAEGGIGGTGITSGPINGFGSIIVNGVRFDVAQAEILFNGVAAVEQRLRPGMVVQVYAAATSP